MSSQYIHILLVDDTDYFYQQLNLIAKSDIIKIDRLSSLSEVLSVMNEFSVDLIIVKHPSNPDASYLQLLRVLLNQHIPVILITDPIDIKLDLEDYAMSQSVSIYHHDQLLAIFKELLNNQDIIGATDELKRQVKKSEYQYRDLLENANDFIFTLDQRGNFVYLNNRFHPLTGFDKTLWLNQPLIDLITPDFRGVVNKQYDLAHQGKARVFEAQIQSNYSQNPVISFSITPIFEKGEITGSMGIGRDVTETKKMEKEILELKNFNESIIQSMEAGLLTVDLNETITSLNTGGEKIFHWNASEVIGKSICSLLTPEEIDKLLHKSISPGSRRFSREMEIHTKNDSTIYIGFTTMNWLDNRGEKMGKIVSFRDISQIKQMQTEVIRMDRLASLGVLASGIAHEIKNPLAGIKTMAQACEEEFEFDDPKKEYLTRIIRQVNRLDELLKTFFTYAKPNPPNRDKNHIVDILNEVKNLVSNRMQKCKVEYQEIIEEQFPAIHVDANQIQQVLLNLLLNAIDAMPEGGKLTVQANKKSDLIDSRDVEIFISDTGQGIPKEKLETIFDPFFTTKSNGLGLGLSIVYRIIQEHNGEIRVESLENRGTRFIVTLPIGDVE